MYVHKAHVTDKNDDVGPHDILSYIGGTHTLQKVAAALKFVVSNLCEKETLKNGCGWDRKYG